MSLKYKSAEGLPLSSDDKITTAVSFLRDVAKKNYRTQDLRKYLASKRGLSSGQIDEAFRIYRAQLKAEEKPSGRGQIAPGNITSGGRKSRLKNRLIPKSTLETGDRKELSTPGSESKGNLKECVSILVERNRAEGYTMLQKFIESEKDYCSVLDCLENEYHKELNKLAVAGKIRMAQREVHEIFSGIPNLIKFHTSFYEELYQGQNIGYLFVRHFNIFKGYIEYMKNCKVSIDIIRKYLRDKVLQKQLAFLRQRSRRKRDDMVDLLLVPLDRITDCKIFLDQLSQWADSEQKDNFTTLKKASRRISRIADYIEKYKYGISNRNEMNKVQQFLDRQCDIISPNRIIIRRGTMIRRTTGWAARNKRYVFFLFNDVLLWTTQNRELQNIVQLIHCRVMASDSKTDTERKFKIVSTGRKNKTLLLECTSKRQRDDWFEATEKGIIAARNLVEKKQKQAASEDNIEAEGQILSFPQPGMPQHLEVKENTPIEKRNHIRKLSELAVNHPGTPLERSHTGTPVNRSQPESPVASDYEEGSYNFGDHWLKDFETFDDTLSQVSEVDNETIDNPGKGRDQSTVDLLSPFHQKISKFVPGEGKKIVRHNDRQNGGRNQQSRNNSFSQRRVNIVRRGKDETVVERAHSRKSSFTLRLNDL